VLVSLQIQIGGRDAGLLYEVSEKGRDQESQADQNEERPAGNTGDMRKLRHKSIPNRQVIPNPSKTALSNNKNAIAHEVCGVFVIYRNKKSGLL
jgi:hypothetical protein